MQYVTCSMRNKKADAATRSLEFGKLHDKHAPMALNLILDLRGLYIKFGQAAASSPFVPQAYRTAFKQLQSDVPSEDLSLIKQVIEEDLGPISQLFSAFSETACGAASIGQAHVATLRSTGEEVVIKVQYPNAATIFSADMQCLRMLVRLSQPEALPAFSEFSSQVSLELDYELEVSNLERIRAAVLPLYGNRVSVPKVHKALCTKRCITMQYLHGPKLEGAMRQQMAALGMRIDESESMRDWLVRMDAQQDQQQVDDEVEEGRLAKLGRFATRLIGLDAALWAVDKLLSLGSAAAQREMTSVASQSELRAVLMSLVEVHGYEMFVNGFFNADPHPGNLIAMSDGRVGLIDYGQCKELESGPRRAIAELMVKVADDAPHSEIAEAFRRVGVKTEKGGDEFLGKMARLMFGKVSVEMLEPKWHRELHKSDKIVHFPPDLLMVHRVALILRGLSVALRQNLSVAELWREHAERALK